MIDWNKIKKQEETIKKNKEKLNLEKDLKKRENQFIYSKTNEADHVHHCKRIKFK